MLSITSDYMTSTGSPEPYLQRIAAAGFTHVHWCHQWNTDFIYHDSEIEQIGAWLNQYGLKINDVHGSDGQEKNWVSPQEYARRAGVELVKNRIDFASRLGSDVVIMHIFAPEDAADQPIFWTQARRSLDELEPYARSHQVRLALENLVGLRKNPSTPLTADDVLDNFATLTRLFDSYPPDYIGMCFDSGHAHIGHDRLAQVEPLADRIISLHLHDNDGAGDQHRLLFSSTIDWAWVARIIAASPYVKPISLELSIHNTGIDDEAEFLRQAFSTGTEFSRMVDAQRGQHSQA